MTAAAYAPGTACTLVLTLTNTRAASAPAATLAASVLLTTPGTNADGTAGTRTAPAPLLSRPAVNNDLQNVTVAVTLPGGLAPNGPVPAGWTVSGNVLTFMQVTLAGGASAVATFPVVLVNGW